MDDKVELAMKYVLGHLGFDDKTELLTAAVLARWAALEEARASETARGSVAQCAEWKFVRAIRHLVIHLKPRRSHPQQARAPLVQQDEPEWMEALLESLPLHGQGASERGCIQDLRVKTRRGLDAARRPEHGDAPEQPEAPIGPPLPVRRQDEQQRATRETANGRQRSCLCRCFGRRLRGGEAVAPAEVDVGGSGAEEALAESVPAVEPRAAARNPLARPSGRQVW